MAHPRSWTDNLLPVLVVLSFHFGGTYCQLAEGTATITQTRSRVTSFTVQDGYSVEVKVAPVSGTSDTSEVYLTSCTSSASFSVNTKFVFSDAITHDLTLGKDGCMQMWMQVTGSSTSLSVTYSVIEYEDLNTSSLIILLVFFCLCACLPVVLVLVLAVVAFAVAAVAAVVALVVLIVISPFVITFVVLFWPCILLCALTGGGVYGFVHFRKKKQVTAVYLILLPVYCLALPLAPIMVCGLLIGLAFTKCGPSLKSKMFTKKVSPTTDSEIQYHPDDLEVQEFVLQEDDSMPLPIAIGDSDDDVSPPRAGPAPVVVEEVEIPFHVVAVEIDMTQFAPTLAPRLPRVFQMEDSPIGGIEAFPIQTHGGPPADGVQAFPSNGG